VHALDTTPARRRRTAPLDARPVARRARFALVTLATVVRAALGRARGRLAALVVPPGGRWRTAGPEAGMATAEYAIATLAAVGFAGLLLVILKSAEVRGLLLGIIKSALSVG